MGIVFDIIATVIALIILFSSFRKGFAKTITNLVSTVASAILAYTLTPRVSAFLSEKIFLEKFTNGINETVGSICEKGKDAAGEIVYDVKELIGNSQFSDIVNRYHADAAKVNEIIAGSESSSVDSVNSVSKTVAAPVSNAFSDIVAFLAIFFVSVIVLNLIFRIINKIFALPGLHFLDKSAGLILGIILAAVFLLVFSAVAYAAGDLLVTLVPGTFKENFTNGSYLIKLLSKIRFLRIS